MRDESVVIDGVRVNVMAGPISSTGDNASQAQSASITQGC